MNLELCKAFIERKNARPLYGVMWEPLIEPTLFIRRTCGTGRRLYAGDVHAEHLLETADFIRCRADALEMDLPFAYQACGGNQWLEAISGCAIYTADHAIWAKQPDPPQGTLKSFLGEPLRKEWLDKLMECHDAMERWTGENRFNAIPLLHGPLDILVAYMGAEEAAYAFYDDERDMEQCLEKASAIFVETAQRLLTRTHPVQGGYASRMHAFTDNASVTMQNDASYMTSPALFDRFIRPCEERILKSLPDAVYHMHNTSLHLGERIAALGYRCVQISVDPNGPPMENQIAVYKQMQKRVPIMLSCWSMAQMDTLAKALPPQGLCLTFIPAPDASQIGEDGGFRELDQWNAYYRARCSAEDPALA